MSWGSTGSIWADFGLNYEKFQQGVQQVTKELTQLHTRTNEATQRMEQTVSATLERLGTTLSAAAAKQTLLGDSFDANAVRARALEQALDELLMAGVSPTNQRVQELAQELQNVRSRMEQASEAAQQMARETQSVADRVRNLAQEMSQLGSQMSIGLTLPLTALTGFATKAAVDFESAMAKVWTIADMTRGELGAVASQIEDMSTTIPQSAKQLAEGLYDAIGSGITDVAEAMQVLEVAAKAGQAGVTSTAVAMDALTSTINAYGMAASDASQLADVMFRAMDRGKLTFEEIAGNLGQVISTAAVAGVQFEEVAAAFATLTKGGVGAAEAATAINQTILSIIQPSQQAAQYAEQLGIEFNAAALEAKGLSGVLEDVYRATGGNIEAMTTLFSNVRALKGALGLTRNDMQDYTEDLEAMATASGAAERAFEKQMQTTAAQMQLLRNEVANLGRSLGSELLPMLNSAVERIKPLVQAFTDLPDGVQRAIVVFATVTATIGPLMAAVGGLVSLLSGPAGIIVAVTAVGSALYGLISTLRDTEGQMTRVLDSARDTIHELRNQAQEYGNTAWALNELLDKYEELAAQSAYSEEAQRELQDVVRRIGEIAPEVVDQWDDVGNAISINAERARGAVKDLLEARKALLEAAALRAEVEEPYLQQVIAEQEARVEAAIRAEKEAHARLLDAQKKAAEAELLYSRSRAPGADQAALRREAYQLGLISEMDADSMMPVWQIAEHWKYELAQAQRAFKRAATSAQQASEAYFNAKERLAEIAADRAELKVILEQLEEGDLWAGLRAKRTTAAAATGTAASEGAKAVAQAISDWEAFGQKVRELDATAYGVLRRTWEEISKELTVGDPAIRTWAEARSRALLKVITDALIQFEGDWSQAADAASLEVKSGFASIRKQFEEGAESAVGTVESQFEQWGAKIRELSREAYGGLIAEWEQIAADLASDDLVVKTWASTRASALVKAINDAITQAAGTAEDRWAAAAAAVAREIESGYESVRRKVREGVADDEYVRGLMLAMERIATLEDWGDEERADAIQRILDAETMSAALRAELEWKVALAKKNAAEATAKAAEEAAKKAQQEAERLAREEESAQEQHVRDRVEQVRREAQLNDWSASKLADALQEILDTEEMAARTRSNLAFDVAMARKQAAEQAEAAEKKAAEEAAKAAQKQAEEAERAAREAARAQDEAVRKRIVDIDRQAQLEDWSLARIADAIQAVLDAEVMSADLREELAHRVALNRKRYAEEVEEAEKKAAEEAARAAERQLRETERQRDEAVRNRVTRIQREATLYDWSYEQIALALQEVLDTQEMSADLSADLAYQVALYFKKAAEEAEEAQEKAAAEAARRAEEEAREVQRRAEEEARAQDQRVRDAVEVANRLAQLEDWSYEQRADSIQAILDTEQMSAKLRASLAHDVAMYRKHAEEQAAEAERKAAEKARKAAEKQAEEARQAQEQAVRNKRREVDLRARLEEWSYERIADAIQEILDTEVMSAELRSDLAWDVALNRKRASDEAKEAEKKAAEEAAREAERQAREAAKQVEEEAKSRDDAVKARWTAIQREAILNDWSAAQVADALQEILDAEQMSAKLRDDLAWEVALNRKRYADQVAEAEKKAAEEATREAERQARETQRLAEEAARAQDEAVRARWTQIQRTARLEDWIADQIADALQKVLDTEEMSAKLRIDLAYEVALHRKQAADEAAEAERKAAEQARRDAEKAAEEAARAQDERVREQITAIERMAYLEDWSHDRIADAIQAVLEAEQMGAKLRSDLAYRVAAERKKALDEAAAAEDKATKEAQRLAEEQAREAARLASEEERAREERVRNLVLEAQRQAELEDWSYERQAEAIQAILDAEDMSARLRADLAHQVAMAKKKAAEEEAKRAEQQVQDAERALREEIAAQDARVRALVQAVERKAELEDWSAGQVADALQDILDTEEMTAELRLTIAHDVAMARKREAEEAAAAEARAAEEAFALMRRLGLLTAQDVIAREQAIADASQATAQARAGAVSRMFDAIMQLAEKAKLEELKGIRETLVAMQAKYEAMGEGWELYTLAAKKALEEVDRMIDDLETNWDKALADSILSNLGELGQVILSFQRYTKAYDDPTKALWMTLAEMVMKSRQFAALVDALNPIIEELIDMFGQLVAPLVPIVDILVRILTPVIRAVAAVFAWVADVIVGIYNAVAKTINALLGWLGVKIPVIEKDWRKDYGIDDESRGRAGTQISEITGPTRDLLIELMRPLRVLDSLPVYAASMERAILAMRDAFLVYAGSQAAASGAAESVVNNYYSINTIQIYSSSQEDFDQIMASLGRRAELALLGSGA